MKLQKIKVKEEKQILKAARKKCSSSESDVIGILHPVIPTECSYTKWTECVEQLLEDPEKETVTGRLGKVRISKPMK